MRGSWIWLAIIGLAGSAIVAGYVSGVQTQPPAVVTLKPNSRASSVAVRTALIGNQPRSFSGGAVIDLFSDDEVVAERSGTVLEEWHAPHLTLVVGLCGRSATLESQFLTLDVPLAFDIDPNAPEAAKIANEVRASGDTVLLHVDRTPTRTELDVLRKRVGDFAGLAARDAVPLSSTLAGTGLIALDERGTADPRPFALRGVTLVRRDILADNREEAGYVGFMLERAADRSLHGGNAVVLVRPLPTTLVAIKSFAANHNVEFGAIR